MNGHDHGGPAGYGQPGASTGSTYVPPPAPSPFPQPTPQPSAKPRTSLAVALEQSRYRLMVTAAVVTTVFTAISVKLAMATLLAGGGEPRPHVALEIGETTTNRADITDRNGNLLATSLVTQSLYADPKLVSRPEEAAQKLVSALPDLDYKDVLAKLSGDRRFVWLKRNLTPKQQAAVHRLGIPGVAFEQEERRFYPAGPLTAHIVGFTGIDNNGLAGMEQGFNKRLKEEPGTPLQLSIDLRLQHVLKKELTATVQEFSAIGAAGIVFDVRNGEVLAMVSLPDFDPQDPTGLNPETLFNRATLGVYEMGSTFKIFNSALAFDSGKIRVSDMFDAAHPVKIGRFTINDYHSLHRALTVAEVFQHSSNLGSVRMIQLIGVAAQKAFMTKMGFTRPTGLELPENGWPLVPNPWREINSYTISFGHGISVSPMHTVAAAASVINGGFFHKPTLLKRKAGDEIPTEQVVSRQTSDMMRRMFRFVVTEGTGKTAAVKGYLVGGKTGTADKQKGKHYEKNSRMSSFLGAFPMNDPRYIVYVLVDEPKGIARTGGFATGGTVGAPTVGRIIRQVGPLLNVPMLDENAPEILNSTYLNAAGSTNWQQSLPPVTAPPPSKGSTVASFPTQTKPR
ncbi:cell division protein FtsI (penicillin-binding protein 3) [Azospirillum lipoferum]|uniref:Penicillin-binding protein 2 n=1 Tax=Azospirillum lipoferum TaxID=193 RepID=A0A5A9GXQ6_AZOLI|nr:MULTISPECIES: penicillin-binding protein 2 [Azospirillum]KAA0598364.1 penicillin-binding protein 2 [Azospirillum lipoferum]MCP1609646.1 cell division protein FtsI (penicillin-binding protein 3) [Azospirillum lipoferum]MDW5535047.1 penicillin-binding protein 2 [Azospirillum sp. NL1]